VARPHIEWVQAQLLPWRPGPLGGCRAGLEIKLLSEDRETGALSCLVRYPPGWRGAGPEWLDCDEEFWVVDGALTIGNQRYRENCYAHFPRGYGREGMAADPRQGAVVLTFFSAAPAANAGAPPAGLPDPRRLVACIDAADGKWDDDFAALGLGPLAAGGRMRFLRKDPDSGEITYLGASVAFRQGRRSERHPVVQEFFMLAGELSGELGTMQAGAYCWRPPMIKHAPYCSPTGTLILFRSVGGPQETLWEDPDEPFSWDAPHRPVLPPELAPLMAEPPKRPPRY